MEFYVVNKNIFTKTLLIACGEILNHKGTTEKKEHEGKEMRKQQVKDEGKNQENRKL